MSLKTTYELFFSTFHINWSSKREDDKDYTFEYLCNLMARAWERLFEEGNLTDNGRIYDKDCGDPKRHGDVKNISLETKIQDDMSLLMHDKAC